MTFGDFPLQGSIIYEIIEKVHERLFKIATKMRDVCKDMTETELRKWAGSTTNRRMCE